MIKQIKYFQAVVRTGSFTAAAEECYISQSAVSQQIGVLEDYLGVKLLKRQGRKVMLTEAGEYFYNRSLTLIEEFEQLCRRTARIESSNPNLLRIGYIENYTGSQLQLAVADFSQQKPGVSVRVINGTHEELYDLLRNGKADLILNDQRRAFSDEYMNITLLQEDIEIEIMPSLAESDTITADGLKNLPCILICSQNHFEDERKYYSEIVGIKSDFIIADNLGQARLMAIGGQGFIPVAGGGVPRQPLKRVKLIRNEKTIKQNICAFRKADNITAHIAEFTALLKGQFNK